MAPYRCGSSVAGKQTPIDIDTLMTAAQDCAADIVIMAAYGYSRMREIVFGGCSQTVLENNSAAAAFLAH